MKKWVNMLDELCCMIHLINFASNFEFYPWKFEILSKIKHWFRHYFLTVLQYLSGERLIPMYNDRVWLLPIFDFEKFRIGCASRVQMALIAFWEMEIKCRKTPKSQLKDLPSRFQQSHVCSLFEPTFSARIRLHFTRRLTYFTITYMGSTHDKHADERWATHRISRISRSSHVLDELLV